MLCSFEEQLRIFIKLHLLYSSICFFSTENTIAKRVSLEIYAYLRYLYISIRAIKKRHCFRSAANNLNYIILISLIRQQLSG